jgi:hypothetical protein
MSFNVYNGDPKIFLGKNGAYLLWPGGGGQPVMDAGLENTVFFLLLIRPGWSGNYLFDNEDHEVGKGGRFLAALDQPITSTSLDDAAQGAEQDLERLLGWGLATAVEVTVTNPVGQQIHTEIKITPPDKDPVVLLGIKNGVNWILQVTDPAHRRFA